MTTVECITALFCEVDEQLSAIPKHPHANLWPSEIVTLGLVELSRRVTPLDWSPKPCRSYWIPGSFEMSSSMSEPSNALPRLRTL